MCDWAYHHEALRKQRVIQRKLEAQARMSREKNQDNPYDDPTRTDKVDPDFSSRQLGLSDVQGDQKQEYLLFSANPYPVHPIHHRHVDNTPYDQVGPVLNHPDNKVKLNSSHSANRKHFKV